MVSIPGFAASPNTIPLRRVTAPSAPCLALAAPRHRSLMAREGIKALLLESAQRKVQISPSLYFKIHGIYKHQLLSRDQTAISALNNLFFPSASPHQLPGASPPSPSRASPGFLAGFGRMSQFNCWKQEQEILAAPAQ